MLTEKSKFTLKLSCVERLPPRTSRTCWEDPFPEQLNYNCSYYKYGFINWSIVCRGTDTPVMWGCHAPCAGNFPTMRTSRQQDASRVCPSRSASCRPKKTVALCAVYIMVESLWLAAIKRLVTLPGGVRGQFSSLVLQLSSRARKIARGIAVGMQKGAIS